MTAPEIKCDFTPVVLPGREQVEGPAPEAGQQLPPALPPQMLQLGVNWQHSKL